jgi:phage terminase large subunit-like protein
VPPELTLEEIEAAQAYHRRNAIHQFFPDDGPLRRELYAKHLKFFEAGATHMERLCCSANRVGKTEMAVYEATLHATLDYPHWWKGRRFKHPTHGWVAGSTAETTRDILQAKLVGQIIRDGGSKEKLGIGTGMIPEDRIVSHSPKAGIPNGLDTVWVRAATGGISSIGFKTYGGAGNDTADAWMGSRKDYVILDEEPPSVVYFEALTRLMSTVPGEENGIMIVTFTPLAGYTEIVKRFLESDDPDSFVIQIGWRDAPHLTPEIIAQMSKKFLPSQLRARSEGIPAIGEGAIYPIDIDEISVDPFKIPETWPKCYGLDVGKTAVVWLAWDKDADVVYAYDCYFSTEYNPTLHTEAIKARGPIPGVIDPSSLQSNQMDGQNLFVIYKTRGLNLEWERTGVESGIQEVWMRLSTGRLKFFTSLTRLRMEFQRYHRQKSETVFGVQDKIVKKDDHCIDALRYGIVSGLKRAKTGLPPRPEKLSAFDYGSFASGDGSWQVM